MTLPRALFALALAAGLLTGCRGRGEHGEHPSSTERDTAAGDRHSGRTLLPDFARYMVPEREIFRDTPSGPDLETAPWARRFLPLIEEGLQRGPNFAGHYVVVSWDCGSSCRQSAIVDVITGRIYPGPQANNGYHFRIDSRLMIVDPPDSARPGRLREEHELPQAWLWRTGRIEQLR